MDKSQRFTAKNRRKYEPENDTKRQWELYYQNIKKDMVGTDQEKEQILRKRILRNFQDYKLETDLFYVKRKDLDSSNIDVSQISPNSLFLYGIDFMPSIIIKHYFQPYEVSVSIYDDSHCEVSFQSSQDLMQCFYSKLIQKPANLDAFYSIFQKQHSEMIEWRQVVGYTQMTIERRLWLRFLTKYDYDDKKQVSARTMMDTFENAKANFLVRQQKLHRQAFKKNTYDIGGILKKKVYVPKNREADVSSCGCCCAQRFNKFFEMMSCAECPKKSHHLPKKIKRQSTQVDENERDRTRERSRLRPKKWQQQNQSQSQSQPSQLKSLPILSKPLPIIQQITKSALTNNIKQDDSAFFNDLDTNFGDPITSKAEEEQETSRDSLFDEMLQEFTKYTPFDHPEKQNQANQSKIFDRSVANASFSYYECDSGDAQ